MEPERTTQHRCPSCGSRLGPGARTCRICGTQVPFRLTRAGTAIESALVVVLIVLVVGAFVWLRRAERGRLVTGPTGAPVVVVAVPPTDVPTLTIGAPPTETRPANTPDPPTATPLPETVTHVVASGDTLYGIAQRYGVTAEVIVEVNGLDRPDALSIGQQLLVPMPRAADDVAGTAGSPIAASAEATTTLSAAIVPAEVTAVPDLAGSTAGEQAARALEPAGEAHYAAPWVLAPYGGVVVTSDTLVLRWSSVGLLPPGVYYDVSLREAGQPETTAERVWVTSNATALRVPSSFRPALGTSRDLEWSVAVHRRGRRLIGTGGDVLLSHQSLWQAFTWAPGRAPEPTP